MGTPFSCSTYSGASANACISDLLQMLTLPPPSAITKVLHTDEFVIRTDSYFHAGSGRLVTIGNPYFKVPGDDGKVIAEKVSPHQFRVFHVTFPDPNKFALVDSGIYDAATERLVWVLRGFDVGRGGPLGVGVTGHPLFDKLNDAENPGGQNYGRGENRDLRQNVCMDPKSVQMVVVGCQPAVGMYWDKTEPCEPPGDAASCPPLVLKNDHIGDGDMIDIGFGAMNNAALNESISAVPLDIAKSITKHPDVLKMAGDRFGNSCWFCLVREQMFARHLWARNGEIGDNVPRPLGHADDSLYLAGEGNRQVMALPVYFNTPSGSIVSSDTQLFNRPLWLQRAQGKNNGVCWNNELFLTIADNTRGTNLTISVASDKSQATYKENNFKQYSRHCEVYELSFVVQLARVPLNADTLAQLHTMDPTILENWNIGFQAVPAPAVGEQYRYLDSQATKCPTAEVPPVPLRRYGDLPLWEVDVSKSLSTELDSFPLGRKFLYQAGLRRSPSGLKRRAAAPAKTPAKRKRR